MKTTSLTAIPGIACTLRVALGVWGMRVHTTVAGSPPPPGSYARYRGQHIYPGSGDTVGMIYLQPQHRVRQYWHIA
jgi:hypothetical protein